jgi:16S rRNA (cytidine1402-2'-O)-methyltransferase
VTALVLSGLPAEKFLFLGFLPTARGARRRELEAVGELPCTLIFYEAPHRLSAVLGEMAELWPARTAAVTRELTKLHQTVHEGTLTQLAAQFAGTPPKGECVLLLAPYVPVTPASSPRDWLLSLEELAARGLLPKEGIAQVAARYGVSKNAVAQVWQRRQKKEDG